MEARYKGEVVMANVFNISKVAYELYKQEWIDTHTTRDMRLDALREYHLYRKECINNDFEVDSFDEWISEAGYGSGSLYACYAEFCDIEYHDKEHMCELLSDKKLIELYYSDIENDNEP